MYVLPEDTCTEKYFREYITNNLSQTTMIVSFNCKGRKTSHIKKAIVYSLENRIESSKCMLCSTKTLIKKN